jgi:hypothetical protein
VSEDGILQLQHCNCSVAHTRLSYMPTNLPSNQRVSAADTHRLAAESTLEHGDTPGGARYQLCTAQGQMFVTSSSRIRHRVPGLTERIQKLFPHFGGLVGIEDKSGMNRRGWRPSVALWTNNADATKARELLGVTTR